MRMRLAGSRKLWIALFVVRAVGTCNGWTSSDGALSSVRGRAAFSDAGWSAVPGETRNCASSFQIHCFQQP